MAFHVSSRIRAGLVSGIYMQTGGVIRDAVTGAIVKHLVPVIPDAQKVGLLKGAFAGLKKMPRGGVVAIVVVAVAGLTGFAYSAYRAPIVKAVENYQVALSEYLKAISQGRKVPQKLSALLEAVAQLKIIARKRRFSWIFPEGIFEGLTELLRGYTLKLAEVNQVSELDLPELAEGEGKQLISEIEAYLQAQKNILDSKANN